MIPNVFGMEYFLLFGKFMHFNAIDCYYLFIDSQVGPTTSKTD